MNLAPIRNAFESRGALAPWLDQQRQQALDGLLDQGFPTRRDELWKYTRTDALAAFVLAALPKASSETISDTTREQIRANLSTLKAQYYLAFVNGVPDASLQKLPEGVALSTPEVPASAKPVHTGVSRANALALLNTALPTCDAQLTIPAGLVTDQTIHLVHVIDRPQTLSQIRLSIHAGANSTTSIAEHFGDSDNIAQMHNSVTNIQLDKYANLSLQRLQQLAGDALQVTRIEADLAASARLNTFTMDVGAGLTRNDLNVRLSGEQARVDMTGIYLGNGKQHIDNHTRVDHIARDTFSNEDYRGILGDQCRCVFNGKVMVHEGADGTDASQSNPNLLLSDLAEIDTKPELEIYADDVKCAHGATVGQLDEKSLFYLRSRGIDHATAMQLLTYAFCRETLGGIADPALRTRLEHVIADQIPDFSALDNAL